MTNKEWARKLEEATERSVRWYPPWNEREHVIVKCEGYPNVPLLGTQGAINYNPELAVRQAGYPIIVPPSEKALTPFALLGPEAWEGIHYRKIRRAWINPTKRGTSEKLRSCGASAEYRQWVEKRVKDLKLPWDKVQPHDPDTQPYEVQETLEVERLKRSLDQTRAERAHWKRKLEEALDEIYHEKHLNEEISKKARTEHDARLRIGSCLRAADQEMCARRAERNQELLREQERKALLEAVRARTKAEEDEAQLKETIQELKQAAEGWKRRCQDIADSAEEQVNAATAETLFWKDRFSKLAGLANRALRNIPEGLRAAEGMVGFFFIKLPREITNFLNLCRERYDLPTTFRTPNHQYHTRARTRHMEQAIDELEQQNIQTRAEVGQMRENMGEIKEQLNKVFELLTRNVPPPAPIDTIGTASNAATQGTPTYPPGFTPQYGMPLGWNTPADPLTLEEPEMRPLPPATASLPHCPYSSAQAGITLRHSEVTPVRDEKISSLEQRVRLIEGTGGHGLDAADLCLMSDVALPADFKTPKFEKYKGSSCPRVHLAMYCRKMAAYVHHDKILVHCFQDSLTGPALTWYVNLEKGQVKTWRDLAEAFIRQYRYNEDMAPDRSRLQNLSKPDSEGFKDYAQRWRELAAQVKPPLTEKEMVSLFIETLPAPFYDKTVGSVASNFADLVIVGERIEVGIKRGRFTNNSANPARKLLPERRKGEANAVTIGSPNTSPITLSPSGIIVSPNTPSPSGVETASPTNAQDPRTTRLRRVFTPIPMSYTALFHQLLQKQMITTMPLRPLEPPYPRNYNPNAKCEYHEGGPGHTTENCWAFKHKVQDLLEQGWLKLEANKPNVSTNPLPPHEGASVNALDHESTRQDTEGQTIPQIAVIEQGEILREPITIYYDPVQMTSPSLTISVAAQPAYRDNHAVPWLYEPAPPEIAKEESMQKRSGRIYTPEALRSQKAQTSDKRPATQTSPAETPRKEDEEFLKIIRRSEHQLLDQMNKTPARISLLSLLLHSEAHRNLLLKVLQEAHVAHNITTEKFGTLVSNITSKGHLTFSEDEIPKEGKGHNQPLHISVKCGGYMIARVLVDNGSSLNVLPKATLDKLTPMDAQLTASSIVVRAFDGSKREVMGEISLPILIGPVLFNIDFQVMDIRPAYSCLLGRPWIHAAGAVPSSLHQQVKFISDHRIISVTGEKELVITTPVPEEYIEGDEEALETSFQSLEIDNGQEPGRHTPSGKHSATDHDQGRIPTGQRTGPPPDRHTSPNPGVRKPRTIWNRLPGKQPPRGRSGARICTRERVSNWGGA
ncbi:hypothetical protein CR513_49111, partial [Mucuna pruriens]